MDLTKNAIAPIVTIALHRSYRHAPKHDDKLMRTAARANESDGNLAIPVVDVPDTTRAVGFVINFGAALRDKARYWNANLVVVLNV